MKRNIFIITLLFLITYSCTAPGGNKEILPAGLLKGQATDSTQTTNHTTNEQPKTGSSKESKDSLTVQKNATTATDSIKKK